MAFTLALAACGSTPSAAPIDAAPPIDAATSDARVDANLEPGGPLRTTLGEPPYAVGAPDGTDVREFVTGGSPPYTCARYFGPGPGTVPIGVQQTADPSGCVYQGGVDTEAGDLPGTYGFTVTVTDEAGASVDVPVAYQGPSCTAGNESVSPAPWPARVAAPGTSQTFTVSITELDGITLNDGCGPCADLSLLTRTPLQASTGLICSNPGSVCSDCSDCIQSSGECPGTAIGSLTRQITLKDHDPLRADGGPAWATLSVQVTYSGDRFDPCGSERFACQIEVLELP